MNQFKCKMCGAPIIVEDNQSTATCEYCMSMQTVPTFIDEPKIALLHNRANSLRLQNEFDKALANYENILIENPNDSEAHWGALLCRYGIEYVTDPLTKKRIPTCHRTQTKSIFDDIDYLGAINNASEEAKHLYQEEAETINQIQKGILSISVNEKPYDIFICYKETDETGSRTKDSVIAQEIYDELTKRKYKVFFSRITLESKLGTQYEPYIYAALNSSKVMLVVGTKPEYFNAVWVRNEWARFLEFITTSSTKKYIIPCYKDMDAYELPNELISFQSQNMDKLGFIQDLIRGIDKIFDRTETVVIKETQVIEAQSNSVNPSVDAMLRRSEIELSRGNTKKAQEVIDQALNLDPENAKAYLLLAIIDLGLTKAEDLVTLTNPLTENDNYNLALQFASPEYKKVLEDYNQTILKKAEEARLLSIYNSALKAMQSKHYDSAIDEFKSIVDYKDSRQKIEECKELIKEEEYIKAKQYEDEKHFREAIESYQSIIDYKDSEHRIRICEEKIEETYTDALNAMEAEDYETALHLFGLIKSFKDVGNFIDEANNKIYIVRIYKKAIEYIEKKQYVSALNALEAIKDYKDSKDLIKDLEEKNRIVAEERLKRQRKNRITILTVSAILICIICLSIIIPSVVTKSKYNRALEFYEKGDYEEAISLFEELGDYKDSDEYFTKSLNALISDNGFYTYRDSLYFGMYPQNLVEDSSTNTSLNTLVTKPTSTSFNGWASYEYYINGSKSNYMWYIDVDYNNDTYRGVYFTSYRPYNTTSNGTGYQDDNGYYTNTIYWFRYDPIKWLILSEEKGKKLIIADLILDSQDYNPSDSSSQYSHNGGTGYTNNYELSNIRKWLNDNFYNTAFNDSQKEMILTTSVDNSVSSTGYSSNDYACNDTNDKIFLLSYEEVMSLFTSPEKRKAQGSDYAKCQGLYVYNSYSYWWLRSPYNYYSINARDVGYGGSIHSDDYVINTYRGIRPACWIETN